MSYYSKGIILASNHFSFFDEKAGRRIEGVKIELIKTEDLSPTEEDDKNNRGYNIIKANLPYEFRDNIVEVPGIYDFTEEMVVDKKTMKGVIQIVNFEYASSISEAAKTKKHKSDDKNEPKAS